jgi:hypothetical protein
MPPSLVYPTKVQTIDNQVIRLTFSNRVKNDVHSNNPGNYLITPILGSSPAINISKVFPSDHPSFTYVDLVVDSFPTGLQYQVGPVLDMLLGGDNLLLFNYTVLWNTSITKVTNALTHIPQMFNTEVGSNLRTIIQAIMLSDENIGGSFDQPIRSTPP